MRRFWRTFSNNSRRKYQLLLLCLIILALNFMNSTLVFKSTHLKSPKHLNNGNSRYKKHNPNLILNTEHTSVKADSESKTVSYNEVIPDAILNEDINVVTEKNYIEKDYSNENYGTFPSAVVDNPWFSDHIHQNGDDPLGMNVSLMDNTPIQVIGCNIQKR